MEGNKKAFLKYVNGKRERRTRANICWILDGLLINREIDKAGKFNAFFTSVFNNSDRLWDFSYPELEDCDFRNYKLPVNLKLVWDLLLHPDRYRLCGLMGFILE